MTANRHEQYLKSAVMTASKEELTLMLYNGAIKFCNLAIKGIEDNKIEVANNNIIKVQNIVDEFSMTLNKDYEVSQGLELLYDYMTNRLVEANIKKDKAIVEEVAGLLRELRDTWKEAMVLSKAQRKTS